MNDQEFSPFEKNQQPEEGSAGSENIQVKFCGICGTPLQEGDRFCTKCGTPVFSGVIEEEPENPIAKGLESPIMDKPGRPIMEKPKRPIMEEPERPTKDVPPTVPKPEKKTKKWIPIVGAFAGGVVICAIVLGLILGLGKKNRTAVAPAEAQAPVQDYVEYGQDYAMPELDFADNTYQEPDDDWVQAPYNQQIVRISKGTTGYELAFDRWLDSGEWETAFSCKAIISDYGVTSRKTEGDGQTPAGTFNILYCIGKTKPLTDLDFINITSGDVWVDDTNSKYYNTLQRNNSSSKDWRSAEDINSYFQSGTYNAAIFFDYNGDGMSPGSAVSGGGSVIFLFGRNDLSGAHSTSGDIYISSADMTVLLTLLDSAKNPIIFIE